MDQATIIRFLVTAFFAINFLQSGFDKLFDRPGNLEFFDTHFRETPLGPFAGFLLSVLTAMELAAGGLCGLGLVFFSFLSPGLSLAYLGVILSALALLALLTGQRLARDYAGAAVIATYFAVAIIGLTAF